MQYAGPGESHSAKLLNALEDLSKNNICINVHFAIHNFCVHAMLAWYCGYC